MPGQLSTALAHHNDLDADHDFLPDFSWASVSGGVVLAACVLLISLTSFWGVALPGPSMSGGGAPSLSTYYRDLAGAFLMGFLVVPVARSLSSRTR
jgi:hypothetical protein